MVLTAPGAREGLRGMQRGHEHSVWRARALSVNGDRCPGKLLAVNCGLSILLPWRGGRLHRPPLEFLS